MFVRSAWHRWVDQFMASGWDTHMCRAKYHNLYCEILWPESQIHTAFNPSHGQCHDSKFRENLVSKVIDSKHWSWLTSLNETTDNFRYSRRKLRPCEKISLACFCVLSRQECWYPNVKLGDRTTLPPHSSYHLNTLRLVVLQVIYGWKLGVCNIWT